MTELGLLARLFRWLSNFFWPGDYDRDLAKDAYKAYLGSKDVASLESAIKHFQLAVDQYRKHKSPSRVTTLINYAVAVRKHYEECGRSPEDLEKVIDLNTEARDSWPGKKEESIYVILLTALAGAYFEQYQRAVGIPPVKPEGRQKAFDNAVKCYTELKDNSAAGSQRSSTHIQLGIMFRMRCERDQTLAGFEIGLLHLQAALSEATDAGKEIDAGEEGDEAKEGKTALIDDIKATCLLHLADSYEVRYVLGKDPRKTHDLTMAIDSNTKAKSFLDALDRPELPACLFNLARQLRLRWLQTRDQSDYDTAKEVAEAARNAVQDDDPLKKDIDQLVKVLEPESRQGTLDSVDMHMGAPSRRGTFYEDSDSVRVPMRRGTVISMDIPQPLE